MLGAALYSSIDVSWEEFAKIAFSLKEEFPELDIHTYVTSEKHEVGIYQGEGRSRPWLTAVFKKEEQDYERSLPKMTQVLGIPQKTLVIMDMNRYELAENLAKAFIPVYLNLWEISRIINSF
jgi:hypothetical protein